MRVGWGERPEVKFWGWRLAGGYGEVSGDMRGMGDDNPIRGLGVELAQRSALSSGGPIMIRRILGRRRPAVPSLAIISTEEELALLRVELMYGLRVNREAYLHRKMVEREEATDRIHRREAAEMFAELRGRWERAGRNREQGTGLATVVDLQNRRHLRSVERIDPT